MKRKQRRVLENMRGACAQRGAVLAVSLVMLVVLTLIGITAMRTATLQERMAGAMRDQGLAFQAAEAGLHAGEEYLRGLSRPIALNDPDNGLYHWDTSPLSAAGTPKWRTADFSLAGVVAKPQFVIEQLGASSPIDGMPTEAVVESLAADTDFTEEEGQLFRVTARAVGGSDAAEVILQSTYRP